MFKYGKALDLIEIGRCTFWGWYSFCTLLKVAFSLGLKLLQLCLSSRPKCKAENSSGDMHNKHVKVCVNLSEKVRTRKGERGTG